jgi:hypothetical protein
MARARTARQAQPVEPEDESQEQPEEEAPERNEPKAAAKAEIVSKADATRAALKEGIEGPQEAVAFIRKRFGIEMAPQHFSAVKSQIKKREGSGAPKGKPGRKPKSAAKQAAESYLAPPPKQRSSGEADLIESLEPLKPLITQYGPDKIKRLVDLLG